jgi:hypothetical protein
MNTSHRKFGADRPWDYQKTWHEMCQGRLTNLRGWWHLAMGHSLPR